MIQFNLLPDVKLEYIKARRTKHIVMLSSFVVTGVSIGLIILLFVNVNVLQKRHLDNLNDDIQAKTSQLKAEQDIDKILTVQNQLATLNGLHDAKPAAKRLGTYLAQVTPDKVTISDLKVDFTAKTMTFDGGAEDLKAVNTFIDTLKFTTFDLGEEKDKHAFSNVVLASFSRTDDDQSATNASYQITLAFDSTIFDIKESIRLKVPDQITTRSVTERPAPLFQQQEGGQ